MPAYFAVPADEDLLTGLAAVARELEMRPSSLIAVLGPSGGALRWFTFRCTPFGRDLALSYGFFVDVMGDSFSQFVCARQHEHLAHHRVLTAQRRDGGTLEVRSDGAEVIVTAGQLPDSTTRDGDAWTIGLAALGLSETIPALDAKAERVVLRRDRSVVLDLSIEPARGRLPAVQVLGSSDGEAKFDAFRDRATVRFAQRQPRAVAPAPNEVMNLGRRWVAKPGQMPDFTGVSLVKGHLCITSGYKPDGSYGVPVVDLGDVVEMKHPSTIQCPHYVPALIGRKLVKACDLQLGQGSESYNLDSTVTFPVLTKLAHASLRVRRLSLPALRTVKKLTIPIVDRLELELPVLAEGTLQLDLEGSPDLDAIRIFAPKLSSAQITLKPDRWSSWTQDDIATLRERISSP